MSRIEYCGRLEPHLPHEWDSATSAWLDTQICAGEIHPNDQPHMAILHLVLATAMRTASTATTGYGDDYVSSEAKHAVKQAFEDFSETLRDILER